MVGRKSEQKLIKRLLDSEQSELLILYGRRRVGKTFLVNESIKMENNVLCFEGLEQQRTKEQIEAFLFQFEQQTGNSVPRKRSSSNWLHAFQPVLEEVKKNHKTIIFLDEFQWLANYRNDLVSKLKLLWEQYLQKYNVKLILCGSIASFMIKKVIDSAALYGRASAVIHLEPFHIEETKEFLSERGLSEILNAHLIFGGIPKYLECLEPNLSIYQNITKLIFSQHGLLIREYNKIFISHFGKKAEYEQILELLFPRPYGLSRGELSDLLAIAGGELTRLLFNLESAGFIKALMPFDQQDKIRNKRYILSDYFIRFHLKFIKPNLNKIKHNQVDFLKSTVNSPSFLNFMARNFELLFLEHAELVAEKLGFSGIDYEVGAYFRHTRKSTLAGVQVDLVFSRADNVVTLCEIKYSQNLGIEIVKEFEDKLSKIKNDFANKTIQKFLSLKTKFQKK